MAHAKQAKPAKQETKSTSKAKAAKADKRAETAKAAEKAAKADKGAGPVKAGKSAKPAGSAGSAKADKRAKLGRKAAKAAAEVLAATGKKARRAAEKQAEAVVDDLELAPEQAKQLVEQVAADIIAADAASAGTDVPAARLTELLKLTPGTPVDLAAFDPRATPGVESRAQAEAQLAALADRVSELQERLYAAAAGGGSNRRVLLVLQGMDTSGKGGTVRHVVGLLDPNGTRLKAFKAPTPAELEHDFLWRIRGNVPEPGQVGIFDRSHYEDVLVARVRKLVAPMHIGRRYNTINRFEKSLADDGCVVVKCFLHISPEEQRERLLARLEDPDKHWKYNAHDVDDRLLWPDFQEAYRIALERCGTESAPWHVIPADRKWYRNYAVLRLLIEALEGIDPKYPAGDFDVDEERARILAS
jgi:PPK2 family polyphosphate:nucleotide phosphotransferase